MFDWLAPYLSFDKSYVGGAITSLSCIAALITIHGRMSAGGRQIYFQHKQNEIISKYPEWMPTIQVGEQPRAGKTLTEDVFFISNRTTETLTDDDFVDPIVLRRRNPNSIYSVSLIEFDSDSRASVQIEDDGLRITDLHIPRSSSLTLRVLSDTSLTGDIAATTKKALGPKKTQFTDLPEFLNVMVPALFPFALLILYGKELTEYLSLSVIWYALAGLTCLMWMPLVFSRRAAQPPQSTLLGRLLDRCFGRTGAESAFVFNSRKAAVQFEKIPQQQLSYLPTK